MVYLLIILDILAVWWFLQAIRQFPRTNQEILDLQDRSRDLSLVERTILEHKIKSAQQNFDGSMTLFAIAIVLNCLFGFYKLISWGMS